MRQARATPGRGTTLAAIDGTPEIALLYTGLETLGTAAVLLDDVGHVAFLTPAAERMLGVAAPQVVGRRWAPIWAAVCPTHPQLTPEPQRLLLRRGAGTVAVRAWRRPLAGTSTQLVSLEDLTAADAQEHELLGIYHDAQQQADDLFALYQITQSLGSAPGIDQLYTVFLGELTRLTAAGAACLYLVAPLGDLQPMVWQGLPAPPPTQPDPDAAAAWLQAQAAGVQVLSLPLWAEDQLMGLALLAHPGPGGHELRLLQTVAKEMGTAILVMTRRQALLAQEQKLEAIVTGTTDAIIGVGADRQVRDFNPAAERLTGYTAPEALAETCAGVLGCNASSGCGGACPFAQVLASREPIPYIELAVAGRNGRRPVAASVAALDLDPAGAPAAVAILRDMSKPKQIEQMKADFLAAVSHQLRTPLALLRGYSDTLLHLDLSAQEQRTCVTGLAATITRLERLIAQILDVTQIDDNRLDLQCEPVRLVDIVRAAIMDLPHSAYRSRIWTELAADLPLVEADPQRLEQVLINLLDNALKYSAPRGQVIIRAAKVAGGVRVQVLDEGIGVPAADQDALFTKFHRASNARHLQVPGTGLGLFICRSIVEAHRGQITLESTPGAGTCVSFSIPLALEGEGD